MFGLLLNIDDAKVPGFAHRPLKILSDATFAAYLLSWIFDNIFHTRMLLVTENKPIELSFFLKTVPFIFICSLACGIMVTEFYSLISKQFKKTNTNYKNKT